VKRGLPVELFLGLKYLTARSSRTNLSLFVWIGIGGVALGVAALIVVLATMTGFQSGIRDQLIAAHPHVLIMRSGGGGLTDADRIAARVAAMRGVRSATPFVDQQALFTTPDGGARGGLIRGLDFTNPAVRTELDARVRTGGLDGPARGEAAILLGAELARALGVVTGDFVTVVSPKGALTAVGMVPRMRRYRVAGTVSLGLYDVDSALAYLNLPAAQEFADTTGVTAIEVKLRDPFEARRVGLAIARDLGRPYWTRDWMDSNKNLFAALELEKYGLFLIVTIIVLVAAFAIIGHLVLLVAEKRKEIGVLKALGATGGTITAAFFTVGMTIGVAGTVVGSAVGLALIWVQNTWKVIRLSGDVYMISHLPMRLTPLDFTLVVGATLLLSFLAAILPARRAGQLLPVDVLRYE
jgi:lipoprotein-releasing system permease protein